ncbi:hypothetical protein [Micromonospora globispora]|nr:hypothetical protein [Micromonospora globispora]
MSQHTRTEAPRPMPRGGALLLAGERALKLCRRQYQRSGWRRD